MKSHIENISLEIEEKKIVQKQKMDLNSLSNSFKEKLSSKVVTNGVKSHGDDPTYVLENCNSLSKFWFDLWIPIKIK